jgi:hypothetical protein
MKPTFLLFALALSGCCCDFDYNHSVSIHRHARNERPWKAVPDDPSQTRYFLPDGTEYFPFREKGTQ